MGDLSVGANLQQLPEDWTKIATLEKPQVSDTGSIGEVLVTSLHWTTTEAHSIVLLVGYMHHGILYVGFSPNLCPHLIVLRPSSSLVDGSTYNTIQVVKPPGLMRVICLLFITQFTKLRTAGRQVCLQRAHVWRCATSLLASTYMRHPFAPHVAPSSMANRLPASPFRFASFTEGGLSSE